ncbi:hypothetical protein EPO15_00425 [bacterium]|nr:MAG: hypothetical protein EPO15_00425 [bacterium]
MRALLLSAVLAAPAAAQATRIGAAGGVSGRVTAAAPGASERGLASGGAVFFKDAVQTDARGRLQVMLLDETVFTVGPDSKITLDEFVYDPFTDAGKVTAQVTKGVFRFVTGKVARKKPEGMKVKLPVGTIGIRGTIAGGRVEADGSALVALLGPGADNNAGERPGGMTVENAGGSVDIDVPGYATRIAGPDSPPTPPFPLTPELLAQLSASPEPESGGGSGGGSGSASEESGQDTALGGQSAAAEAGADEEEQSLAETSSFASQSLGSGAFSWDDLRNSLASGSAFYTGNGTYSCSGTGSCSSPSGGTFALHFNVDFGARTIGGGGTSSHFAFVTGPLLISTEIPGSNIPVISFAALTGDAKLTQGTDYVGSDSNFNGSSFKFTDSRHVSGQLVYSDVDDTATGSVTSVCNSGCPP